MDTKYLIPGIALIMASILASVGFVQSPTTKAVQNEYCTIVVDNGAQKKSLSVRAEGSAFDMLRSNFETTYREYGTDVFITGIKIDEWSNSTSEYSWLYLVNNEMPEIAANKYYPESGDRIVFKYMSMEEAMNFFE